LVGFATEEDWFEYRLQNDPRFLQRIERARQSLRCGAGVKLADVPGAKRRRTARSCRKLRGANRSGRRPGTIR
jgi:hypothetical protein